MRREDAEPVLAALQGIEQRLWDALQEVVHLNGAVRRALVDRTLQDGPPHSAPPAATPPVQAGLFGPARGTGAVEIATPAASLEAGGGPPAPPAPPARRKARRMVTRELAASVYRAFAADTGPIETRLARVALQFDMSRSSADRVVRGLHIYSPAPREEAPDPGPTGHEARVRHVLNASDAKEIKRVWNAMKNPGGNERVRIAQMFGTSPETVRRVINGEHRFSDTQSES